MKLIYNFLHYNVRITVAFLVCFACCRVFALNTEWVEQSKSYSYWVSLGSLGLGAGATITRTLESDDFPFTLIPGNYEVIVNSASFDDKGTIGSVSSTGPSFSCPSKHWGNQIINQKLPASDISICPNGKRLQVTITATDDDGCGNHIGWPFSGPPVYITWRAKCGGCSGNSCAAGSVEAGLNSLHFRMGLGKYAYQQNAGQLVIEDNYPGLSLAKPDGIQAYLGASVERINDGATGVLRQVRTSQLLADVIVSNDFCYSVNFYTASNFSLNKINGLYPPTGQPFNAVTVQNPDASTNTYNRLRINTTGQLGDHQYDYTWVANAQYWELITGDGLRKETRSQFWDGSQTILTETNVVLNADDTVAFKQVETYQVFPWDETNLIQRIVNPDGLGAQTNTWSYYTNAAVDGGNYGQLKQITTPSGYWELYQYDSGSRRVKTVAQFKDAPVGAPESQCRVTINGYTTGTSGVTAQSTTVETLLGQETARSYRVDFPGGVSNFVCQTPGAVIGALNNLVTVNTSFTDGNFESYPAWTKNPDGTVSVYQYATNATGLTTTVWSGVPDATGTNVVDGTKAVTVVDLGGNSISNATYDIASGLLLSSAVTLQTDDLGRPTLVQYNDGTTETTQYGCCGLDNTIDRDGVFTQYLYDPAKRQIGYARYVNGTGNNPITFTNALDAAGHVLASVRVGSDDSSVILGQSSYDLAGELIAQTNALDGVTTYSRTNAPTGGTIRTSVYPNGGTRIDTYYADGSLKSVTGIAVHGKAYSYGVEYNSGAYWTYTVETNLDVNGNLTSEWTKTYTDMAGRTVKTLYADNHYSQSFYNSKGQLTNTIDPDNVSTLYAYSTKGELAYTAIDMDRNGTIDFGGTDRITWTTNDVTTVNGVNVRRSRTYVWDQNGVDQSVLISEIRVSTDDLTNWQTVYRDAGTPVTATSQTSYSGNSRSTITTAPDGSYTISAYSYGRLTQVQRFDSSSVLLASSSYGYDPQGRQNTVTDARNGTTTYGFNNADLVTSVAAPLSQTTTTLYDNMMRPYSVIQPDGTTVNSVYLLTGELGLQYGSRTYPVGYGYDYAGRLQTMTNWSSYPNTGARLTTWNYNGQRGWLTSKAYDGGAAGPGYTYTSAGRLASRTWARGITTTYGYDNADGLATIVYSGGTTSNVTNTYDRLGRLIQVGGASSTESLTYNSANQLLSETVNGVTVTNNYDSYLRRTNLSLLNPSSVLLASASYAYDTASRLQTVSTLDIGLGTLDSATYSYLANSPLVGQITFQQSGTTRMTTTKSYDNLNRLTQISTLDVGLRTLDSHTYNYNNANQRTRTTLADGSYWIYNYDSLGQVTSGKKYWSDGTPVAGQQFEYNFDNIGNRTQTKAGGDQGGAGLRPASYSVNTLNQITSRDYPGMNDVIGVAIATNAVTVNGQIAYRKVEYFQSAMGTNNSSAPAWLGVTVASGNNTNTGNIFITKTPETFGYDADGNLTNDGRWMLTWDAENRLTKAESLTNTPTASERKVTWEYDGKGRRIRQTTYDGSSGSYLVTEDLKFVSDGWRHIAELNATNNALVRSYTWGLDLSGSMDGAGGVGGLLMMNSAVNGEHFYAYDGNGNVAALVKASDGTVSANYEYETFGKPIRATGLMAKENPFRFSTKRMNDTTDLILYEMRPYSPSFGRFLGKDPLGDEAFLREQTKGKGWRAQKHLVEHGNLPSYLFAKNSPIDQIDPRGLKQIWGNWCGSDWTGGQNIASTDYDWENDPSPAVKDGLDNCCRKHDACFANWDLDNHKKLAGKVDTDRCDDLLCDCARANANLSNERANAEIQCAMCSRRNAEDGKGRFCCKITIISF